MTLPTAGAVEYDWQARTNPVNIYAPSCDLGSSFADGVYGELMIYRRLVERRVYLESGTLTGTTEYTAPVLTDGSPNLVVTATEKDASAALLRSTVSTFWGTPLGSAAIASLGYSSWKEGRQVQQDRKDSVGTTLQSTVNTWMNRRDSDNVSIDPGTTFARPNDPRLTGVTRTLGAVSATTSMAYSLDAFNNLLERCEGDFQGGAGSRCYQWSFETSPAYTATSVHLRSLVTSERTGTGSGGGFVRQSETKYGYDASPSIDRTSVVEHDPARGPSFTTRGNRTSIETYLDNPVSADPWVRTNLIYDIAGNITQITHPGVKTAEGTTRPVTTVTYDDAWAPNGGASGGPTFAFPTVINHPGGLQTSATYYFNLGRIAKFVDPNGRETAFQYGGVNLISGTTDPNGVDALDRLTRVVHPIGETAYVYTANSTTAQRTLDDTSTLAAVDQFDGLGRLQKRTEPNQASVERQYDALGRVYRISNPSAGPATLWTTMSYDALDRILDVQYPDMAVMRTRYTNNETLTRDPSDKWKKVVSDAFGRINAVIEDPAASMALEGLSNAGGSTFTTSYLYDARNNLTSVDQGGRNRSFSYDSMNRLKTASSPETGTSVQEGGTNQNGTTRYDYDDAGNVITSQDAAGLAINYVYDIRGRVASKKYSDGTMPDVLYCYDGSTLIGGVCGAAPANAAAKNLKGRLTMTSNGVSDQQLTEYDALGRVLQSVQKTGPDSYPFLYRYNNLALKSVQYPSLRTVGYGFDPFGQVTSVAAGSTQYVTAVSYADHGAIAGLTLAGGNRYEKTCFNARLQPSAMLLRSQAPGLGDCNDATGNLATLTFAYGGTANNGNLVLQSISDGVGWSTQQTYGYDKLNRLSWAWESPDWKRTYAYDPWGNRWVDSDPAKTFGLVVNPNTPQAAEKFSVKNRLVSGVAGDYDLRGNQLRFNPYTLGYDADNHVKTVASGATPVASYDYDGDGRRVKRTIGSWMTTFVYDAFGQLAAEYEAGTPPADKPAADCTTCYLFVDHLGSTRAVYDSTGVRSRHDYLPRTSS